MWTNEELDGLDVRPMLEHVIRANLAARLRKIKHRCKKENIPFDLGVDDLVPFPLRCPVFGMPLNWVKKGGGPTNDTPSIDRILPDQGYVKGNVQIISQKANRFKSNATVEEMKAVVDYMENTFPEGGNLRSYGGRKTHSSAIAGGYANILDTDVDPDGGYTDPSELSRETGVDFTDAGIGF